MSLSINTDSLDSSASIEMAGNKKSIVDLANHLITIKNEFSIELFENKSTFYPVSIKIAIFRVDKNNSTITINDCTAIFSAKQDVFCRFGKSLLNIFSQDYSYGNHLHIDKHDGFFDRMDHELVVNLIG